MVIYRSSPGNECIGSGMVMDNGSSNTVEASSNDTPCLRRFWFAFALSQSNANSMRQLHSYTTAAVYDRPTAGARTLELSRDSGSLSRAAIEARRVEGRGQLNRHTSIHHRRRHQRDPARHHRHPWPRPAARVGEKPGPLIDANERGCSRCSTFKAGP